MTGGAGVAVGAGVGEFVGAGDALGVDEGVGVNVCAAAESAESAAATTQNKPTANDVRIPRHSSATIGAALPAEWMIRPDADPVRAECAGKTPSLPLTSRRGTANLLDR